MTKNISMNWWDNPPNTKIQWSLFWLSNHSSFLYMFSLNSLNSVTKDIIILKRLLGSNPLSPVWETETLPLCHRYTANRRQLNSSQFMLQWFLRFPEFAEFSESSALFRENAIGTDTNSQCYTVHKHLNNAWHNKGHWLTGWSILAIIASNAMGFFFLEILAHPRRMVLMNHGSNPS